MLGTSLDVRWIAGPWPAFGAPVQRAVLEEVERLDRLFSTFRDDSELSRLLAARGEWTPVSEELAALLETSARWRLRTGAAFDPAWEARLGAWAQGTEPNAVPGSLWEVGRGPHAGAAARILTDRPLSFNAIAKGTIIDRACEAGVRANGNRDVTVDIGGDIRHLGGHDVAVGVVDSRRDAENAPPLETVRICNQGLATSGGFRRGVNIDGRWRSHLIDPRTGQPAEHVASASVIAPDAETADVLATAFCVLDPDESLALADGLSGVGCLLVLEDGERVCNDVWDRHRTRSSPSARPIGRRDLLTRVFAGGLFLGGTRTRSRPPRTQWDESFELLITFEFGDPGGGMPSRRPFVVAYIDDADANPVRTVGLWALKAPWIRELGRWMRGERARRAAHGGDLVLSAAPTRSPGRYRVLWDGKDDQGAWVEQGQYFVCLETIRQGSSSYFTRQPFTFESTPFQGEMDDYGAFRDIQLDYRQRE